MGRGRGRRCSLCTLPGPQVILLPFLLGGTVRQRHLQSWRAGGSPSWFCTLLPSKWPPRVLITFSQCYPNQSPATVFNPTMWDIFLPLKVTSLLLGWRFVFFFFVWSIVLFNVHFIVQRLELFNQQGRGWWFSTVISKTPTHPRDTGDI